MSAFRVSQRVRFIIFAVLSVIITLLGTLLYSVGAVSRLVGGGGFKSILTFLLNGIGFSLLGIGLWVNIGGKEKWARRIAIIECAVMITFYVFGANENIVLYSIIYLVKMMAFYGAFAVILLADHFIEKYRYASIVCAVVACVTGVYEIYLCSCVDVVWLGIIIVVPICACTCIGILKKKSLISTTIFRNVVYVYALSAILARIGCIGQFYERINVRAPFYMGYIGLPVSAIVVFVVYVIMKRKNVPFIDRSCMVALLLRLIPIALDFNIAATVMCIAMLAYFSMDKDYAARVIGDKMFLKKNWWLGKEQSEYV